MNSFVFITDLHIGAGSTVRTGDVYADLLTKLAFVRDYCNETESKLLIGGDIFNSPSEGFYYFHHFLYL